MPYLKQGRHGAEAVPEHWSKITDNLPLLTQLQQGSLSGLGRGQLDDPLVDLIPVHIGLGGGAGVVVAAGGSRACHRAAGHLQLSGISPRILMGEMHA